MFVTLFGRRNNRGSIRPKSAYYTVPDTSTRMYYRNYIVLFVHPGSSYHTQSKPQKAQHTYYSQDFVQYYTGAWPGTWPVRGGCLGDGLAGAGSFYSSSLYSMPAPQKKCRPYRTITEWDTMLTDETQSRYNLNPATSRTFWFQNRDPLYLTAVKQNIAWGCSAWQ